MEPHELFNITEEFSKLDDIPVVVSGMGVGVMSDYHSLLRSRVKADLLCHALIIPITPVDDAMYSIERSKVRDQRDTVAFDWVDTGTITSGNDMIVFPKVKPMYPTVSDKNTLTRKTKSIDKKPKRIKETRKRRALRKLTKRKPK